MENAHDNNVMPSQDKKDETGTQQQAQEPEKTRQDILCLDNDGIKNLSEIRKWAKFFAVLMFIYLGLLAVAVFFMIIGVSFISAFSEMAEAGKMAPVILFVVFALFIALFFFPTLHLYRFSSVSKTALNAKNSEELGVSLNYLRKYVRFIGIFTIVILCLYALLIPLSIIITALGIGSTL